MATLDDRGDELKRVVVTGSECTGKTKLAEALAQRRGVICIPEYARQFVREKGAAPDRADVEAIARGQISLEEQAEREGHALVIQDTDLLSTVVYSRHYYGDCPPWIQEKLARGTPELYLLAGIEVPWTADGHQRDRGHMREEMQTLFRHALVEFEARFVEVNGPLETRLRDALGALDSL